MIKHMLVALFIFSGCCVQADNSMFDRKTVFILTEINYHAKNSYNIHNSIKATFSDEEIEKIAYVLKYYKEDFLVQGDKIYIPIALASDLDLIANYSKKAFDVKWRESR